MLYLMPTGCFNTCYIETEYDCYQNISNYWKVQTTGVPDLVVNIVKRSQFY